MTDGVRLYVFEGQNFVSEKDYRVAMRNYSIRDADADRLQAQVDRMTVELYRAREAGRREGLEEAAKGDQAREDELPEIKFRCGTFDPEVARALRGWNYWRLDEESQSIRAGIDIYGWEEYLLRLVPRGCVGSKSSPD